MSEQATRTVRIPSPEHPISITKNPKTVRVVVAGKIIAESASVLTMAEAAYSPVHYFPIGDVDASVLRASVHATYCPYKGECSYYDVVVGETTSRDSVWFYSDPFPAVAEIAGHVAFYPDHVDHITEV